jgi:hypothetical protein
MQLVWLVWVWNSLSGHAVQSAVLLSVEKVPAEHPTHVRSLDAVTFARIFSPPTQLVAIMQFVWLVAGWYSLSGHAVQSAELFAAENVPATHPAHVRSLDAVTFARMRSPPTQLVATMQAVWLTAGWNSLSGHAVQSGALLLVE